jgi:hypothetical protein
VFSGWTAFGNVPAALKLRPEHLSLLLMGMLLSWLSMVEWCSFATAAFVSNRLGLLLMGLMLVRKGGCVVVLLG